MAPLPFYGVSAGMGLRVCVSVSVYVWVFDSTGQSV